MKEFITCQLLYLSWFHALELGDIVQQFCEHRSLYTFLWLSLLLKTSRKQEKKIYRIVLRSIWGWIPYPLYKWTNVNMFRYWKTKCNCQRQIYWSTWDIDKSCMTALRNLLIKDTNTCNLHDRRHIGSNLHNYDAEFSVFLLPGSFVCTLYCNMNC